MSDAGKKLSFSELVDIALDTPDWPQKDVELRHGTMTVRSCDSEQMMAWHLENGGSDVELRKFRALRLVARSLVNPDGSRVVSDPAPNCAELREVVNGLKKLDHRENAKLTTAALFVNGIDLMDEIKNVLSRATPRGDSPIVSPESSAA